MASDSPLAPPQNPSDAMSHLAELFASGPGSGLLSLPCPTGGQWTLIAAGLLFASYLYLYTYRLWRLPFKNLPGPPRKSLFWGSFKDVFLTEPLDQHELWTDTYGATIRYDFVLGAHRLATIDPVALGHVLNHTEEFPKPANQVTTLSRLLGEGLLIVQGDTHRRQRRVLAPAFGPAAVRALDDIIWDKAYLLKDKLNELLEDDSIPASPVPPLPVDKVEGARKINIAKYLACMTLDVIGTGGFGYEFESLLHDHNEVAETYNTVFSEGQKVTPFSIMQRLFPILDLIPTQAKRITAEGLNKSQTIGAKLVDEKKAAMEKGETGKDLLSILIKANAASKREDRIDDDQVIAQISTFLLAGNETSSTALTWCLYRLALNPDIQKRLQAELLGVTDERPTPEKLNTLPYLDKVVRESLRLDPPVAFTVRTTARDTVIPLSMPVRGRDGTMMDSVPVSKGTFVDIPIISVHRSKEIWGPDAREFNPDRWESGGASKAHVQGSVYGNLLTFLAGPRNCIGYRLALAEIKVALFVLLRGFWFEQLPSKPYIQRRLTIVMRPRALGEEQAGLQLPLLVRPLPDDE